MDIIRNSRTIHTGLYSDKAYTILDRMSGQLSDGKWENTPGYDKYWLNFNVVRQDDGEVVLNVNADTNVVWGHEICCNPFIGMTDELFMAWCARKVKAVIKDEIKYSGPELGKWDRRNTVGTSMFLGHCEGHGTVVTVADVYCVYDQLLGRGIGLNRYDASTVCSVFGHKLTAEEVAKAAGAREKAKLIREAYAQKCEALKRAKDAAVAKLEKELRDSIAKLAEEERAEVAAL